MKKVEQFPTGILSLLIILIISTTITNGVESRSLLQSAVGRLIYYMDHPPHSSCSSSCGDIPKISYPFRLKGDPQGCGDSDYELSCENNRTIFQFYSGGKYYVKKISYDKHIIRVVDVNLANGTCNLPSRSLSSHEVNDDVRYRGIVAHIYTKFVRCKENFTTDNPGYRLVPCASSEGSYVYANYVSDYSELHIVPMSCKLISTVPGDIIAVRNPNPNPSSYGDIMKVLEAGFDLEWSVDCRDCLVRGDSCVLTTFDSPILYGCKTADRPPWKTIIYIVFSIIWNFLLGLALIARYILCPIVLVVFLIYKCRTKPKSSDTTENVQQGL